MSAVTVTTVFSDSNESGRLFAILQISTAIDACMLPLPVYFGQ